MAANKRTIYIYDIIYQLRSLAPALCAANNPLLNFYKDLSAQNTQPNQVGHVIIFRWLIYLIAIKSIQRKLTYRRT